MRLFERPSTRRARFEIADKTKWMEIDLRYTKDELLEAGLTRDRAKVVSLTARLLDLCGAIEQNSQADPRKVALQKREEAMIEQASQRVNGSFD